MTLGQSDGKGPIVTTDAALSNRLLGVGTPAGRPAASDGHQGHRRDDPIGRAKRELIIGDRRRKTSIGIDAILNQRGSDVKCFCGCRPEGLDRRADRHPSPRVDYTTVIVAGRPIRQPYIALRRLCHGRVLHVQRRHSLIIYDDLSRQARVYRQLSLLIAARRDAKPTRDILRPQPLVGTCGEAQRCVGRRFVDGLPIVETLEGEVSAYPDERDSITDGQIYLQPDLFFAGQRPAMNGHFGFPQGGSAQIPAMKKVAGGLRLDLRLPRKRWPS